MNNKLTALSLCLLMLSADVLYLTKIFETESLSDFKIQMFTVCAIFAAIALLYFILHLAVRIAADREILYRRFLPASFLRFDRSRIQSGFLKRQTSSLKV